MTNPTLTLKDTVLQSLAFLTNEAPAHGSSHGAPLTGLIIGETTQPVVAQIQTLDKAIDWQVFSQQAFSHHTFNKRYDLAVIILSNDVSTDTQIIQRCRDLFAKHCLVVQNLSKTTPSVDMMSFGFSRLHAQPIIENQQNYQESYQVWQFNLFDYKHLPDWFNSKFWANPELWNKFRW